MRGLLNDADTTLAPTTLNSTLAPTIYSHETHAHSFEDIMAEKKEIHVTQIVMIAIISLLLLSWAAESFVHQKHLIFIPEGGATMIVAGITGLIATRIDDDLQGLLVLDPHIFLMVFLPPIIFNAGFSVRKKGFTKNLHTISLYALLGTCVSTAVITSMVFAFLQYEDAQIGEVDHREMLENLLEAAMYGSLISAVDPVGSLAVLASVFNIDLLGSKSNPQIYNLIFGESVLNDAVALVLYNSFSNVYVQLVNDKVKDEDINVGAILLRSAGAIIYVFAGSIAIGMIMAAFTAIVVKQGLLFPGNSTFVNFVILLFSYISFLVCELIGLSGVVCIFFCGIGQSRYTWRNLSPEGKITVPRFFSGLSNSTETVVFMSLGFALTAYDHDFSHWRTWQFVILSLGACALARGLAVFPLTPCANVCRKSSQRISFKESLMMWFSGLRGAVSFALVVELQSLGFENSQLFLSATLIIVVITTFFNGGLMKVFIRCIKYTPENTEAETPLKSPDFSPQSSVGLENINLDSLDSPTSTQKKTRVNTHESIHMEIPDRQDSVSSIADSISNTSSTDDDTEKTPWIVRFERKYLRPVLCVKDWSEGSLDFENETNVPISLGMRGSQIRTEQSNQYTSSLRAAESSGSATFTAGGIKYRVPRPSGRSSVVLAPPGSRQSLAPPVEIETRSSSPLAPPTGEDE